MFLCGVALLLRILGGFYPHWRLLCVGVPRFPISLVTSLGLSLINKRATTDMEARATLVNKKPTGRPSIEIIAVIIGTEISPPKLFPDVTKPLCSQV